MHKDGHLVRLEDKISKLLDALIARRGSIVTKDELIAQVWAGRELSEQTIPVAISKLRKALGMTSTSLPCWKPFQGKAIVCCRTPQ